MKTIICLLLAAALTSTTSSAQATPSSSALSTVESNEQVYISIGTDVLAKIKKDHAMSVNLTPVKSIKSVSSEFETLSIHKSQLVKLSQIIHQDFVRCPGFFAHESLEKAVAFNQRQTQAKAKVAVDYTIDNSDTVYSMLNHLDEAHITDTVEALSAFHNRYYNVSSGAEAAQWIKDKWETIAAGRDDITVELYNHRGWPQPSVIATITGTQEPDAFVIAGGHLDSINGASPAAGRAPGADDNASGIAVLTETLNTIVTSNYKPAKTVVIVGYAAEEVGLFGSQAIAGDYQVGGKNVQGVVQFDMTGYRGNSAVDIQFITDYTNNAQNLFMADLIDNYLPELEYGFGLCGYACSDHASWDNAGYPVSFPFEAPFGQINPLIHSNADESVNRDHAAKFLKLSVTYLAELAKGTADDVIVSGSVAFSNAQLSVDEGDSVTVMVDRVAGQDLEVSVDFTTEDEDAIAGTDYVLQSGTLTWPDQDNSSQSITISTNDVSQNRTFRVLLSNPQGGATIGATSIITVTIVDNTVAVPTPDPIPDTVTPTSISSGGGSIGFLWFGLMFLAGVKVNQSRRL